MKALLRISLRSDTGPTHPVVGKAAQEYEASAPIAPPTPPHPTPESKQEMGGAITPQSLP